uniref:Uncharacterized protein n=1 Tax=Arcella intermedia TaxID=1963864 RepID=A0A6B2LQW4_9EUKA
MSSVSVSSRVFSGAESARSSSPSIFLSIFLSTSSSIFMCSVSTFSDSKKWSDGGASDCAPSDNSLGALFLTLSSVSLPEGAWSGCLAE